MKLKHKLTMKLGTAAATLLLFSVPASAADLILLNGITSANKDGDPVQLRETGHDGCSYIGTFHDTSHTASSWIEKVLVSGGERLTDWSIELTRKRCDRTVSPFKGVVGLSKAHTYFDDDGKKRPGYAAGDRVGVTTPIQAPAH
ncbi:hypothetical protein [Paraburkholderia sp. GAS32]|uniref:hypothetical protein n=1 Tax=Paraburkholderia sp. GAS32 TaxID=3035129 RepID=UPI003D22395E